MTQKGNWTAEFIIHSVVGLGMGIGFGIGIAVAVLAAQNKCNGLQIISKRWPRKHGKCLMLMRDDASSCGQRFGG